MEGAKNSQSVISEEVEITGTVKSAGSIRIDGKLDGDLNCSGDATIGESATLKGNVHVNSVVIAGTLNGNVSAKDRIEMKSTARVNGDIKAKRLAVEDGVTFVGKSEVNPSGASTATPVEKADDSKPSEEKKEPTRVATFAKR